MIELTRKDTGTRFLFDPSHTIIMEPGSVRLVDVTDKWGGKPPSGVVVLNIYTGAGLEVSESYETVKHEIACLLEARVFLSK